MTSSDGGDTTNSRRAFVKGAVFSMFAAIPAAKALATPHLAVAAESASSNLHQVRSDSFRVHPARHNYTVCAPPLISVRTGGRCCVLNPTGDVTCGNEIAHVDSHNPSIVCYYTCGS